MQHSMVLRRISLLASVLALAIVAAPTSGAGPAGMQRLTGLEQAVVRKVNEARAAKGLRPLTVVAGLQTAALSHSRNMLQGGFFDHSSPDGRTFWERIKRTYPPRAKGTWLVGENLLSATALPTAEATVSAWLASPPHRDIVYSDKFRDVGIAVVRSPVAGGTFGNQATWVVTADFGVRGAS